MFPGVRDWLRAVLCLALVRRCAVVGLVWLVGGCWAGASQSPGVTAFGLVREANRLVGEQCRDRVVEIYSERSSGGVMPGVWHVVFYDAKATFRSSVVKFEVGKEPVLRRPMRLLEALSGGHLPLDRSLLKVDSDEALRIAAREPGLAGWELRGTQLALARVEDGPVWRIRLWAGRGPGVGETVAVGEVLVSAADGRVLKSSLQGSKAE